MKAIEFVVRMFAMVVMLIAWSTVGLVICLFLSVRSLLWMTGKTLVASLLDRPPPNVDQFTATILLWPRKLVGFVAWGFGQDEHPATVTARHPAEFLLETMLLSFFVVTVIWANDVKPGYLPDFFAGLEWLGDQLASIVRAWGRILSGLFGGKA